MQDEVILRSKDAGGERMNKKEAISHGKEQLEIFGGEHREFIEMAIKALEQEPKTGHWTPHYDFDGDMDGIECDSCNEWFYSGGMRPHYCPNCGAKMEVSE